ncbi:hypothetical protein M2347_000457 [Chryseobacterium sp. H1D6B]|uniref:hypothetical protein n=1 Tax=Chryseobacterium sp. H1D6B TaxID=2940588 RepID=UPI001818CAD0|nr:hypothetical protein [Chryseobacterium sp. H1D6B]MDH6250730.1 hypothetical protein [Chryseobacterium sp. H1D6B]
MKNNVTVFLILLISLTSCAAFERKMIKDDLQGITEDNVKRIEGKYNAGGYQHINSARTKSDETQGIANMLSLSNTVTDKSNEIKIGLTPLGKKKSYELQFKLLRNDSLEYSFKYKAKLKNGLLLLDNYSSQCRGLPYVFGGCCSFQSRIGLTQDNHLLIQDYYDNSGAVLFIFGAGYTINYAEKYKRIQ